jgi:hypothetical protein
MPVLLHEEIYGFWVIRFASYIITRELSRIPFYSFAFSPNENQFPESSINNAS